MNSELMQHMMTGQTGIWTVAVICGALVGLLDLWLTYRSAREARRGAELGGVEQGGGDAVSELEREAAPAPDDRGVAMEDRGGAEAEGRRAQAQAASQPSQMSSVGSLAAAQPLQSATPQPVPQPSFPRRRLAEAVDPSLTAEELLERADQHLANADRAQAGAHYRGAIRMAQKNKLPAVEAQARIKLGDLSKDNGDLTSACEHWQMARVLFASLEKPADVDATVARMEKAGCPTDWVLNEF